MSSRPRVTVVAASYNHERFIEECLDSIADQKYPNLQLIVTDDCSTDDSKSVIETWLADSSIDATFISHDVNVGLPRTLNEVRSMIDGTYVTVIATDDVMEPGRLHHLVGFFETLPDTVAVVYSDAFVIDETGRRRERTIAENRGWSESPPQGDIFRELLRRNFLPAPSAIVRATCLEAAGPYDESLLFEDWDMWLRLARRFEFRFSNFIGIRYRQLPTSMYSTRTKELAESKIAMLRKWLDEPDIRDDVIVRLRGEVLHLYDLDRRAALPALRLLSELQPGWKSRVRYRAARFGVPNSAIRRIVSR